MKGKSNKLWKHLHNVSGCENHGTAMTLHGRIQDLKLGGGGAHLKKLRRAEGGAKIFGVFRVKNHGFTPKNNIFPILGGAREIFGVFHVKNHDFTPKKKIIFLPILGGGGARRVRPP
jgi:hypothetical protein